ncbi:MAG: tetratricopeptide repeat protein [Nitrospinota bacterium]|nr:tetratricopeptide repeat protein [Nitrospinota bacterium]
MVTQKNKPKFILLAVLIFSLMCGSSVWAEESSAEMEDPFEGKPPIADQLEQFSNEIAKRVHQELQELLDKELKVLQEERKKNRYTVEERIAKQENLIKDNPKNAEAHFALGEAYDEMRAGANAIVYTQIAEQLYKEQENKIGLAESRRNLRRFFEKYGFQKEDFLLN